MNKASFPYQRVIVVGTTASGKSTLAEKLAQKLHIDYIELDALHWLPNWQPISKPEFRALLEQATSKPGWVIAGNYSSARDISWPKAQVVIWLDYSFSIIFWRLWHRTWRRWWTHELLWGSNYERMWTHLKLWSKEDSLFRWLFATYWRRKREYPHLLSLPEYAHLHLIHFQTPQDTDRWLENL